MKLHTLLLPGLLLLAPLTSCAESDAGTTANYINLISESGDILTLSLRDKTSPSASYFSTAPAERPELATRMLNILNETNASKSIIDYARSKLIKHPRLKRANFKVKLTDDDGTIYMFNYISDPDSGLYVLNYEYIGAAKA